MKTKAIVGKGVFQRLLLSHFLAIRNEERESGELTIRIVKHLSKDDVCPSVDFLLQVFDLDLWTL